jgi:hypothetical protein
MAPVLTRSELESRIAELQTNIVTMLAPYEPQSAVGLWLDMLRGIEELINLPSVDWDDDAFEQRLYDFPVRYSSQHLDWFMEIRRRLIARFSETFANRISNLVFLGDAIASSLAIHGFAEAASGFDTLASLVGYLQSRRRHFVGLLHVMPTACRGSVPVEKIDTLNIFLPIIELSALPMMGAQNALLVKLAQERLRIPPNADFELAMLDRLFLEPERVSIVEMPMTDAGRLMLRQKESLLPDRLFSAAELRNDILLVEAAYAEFNLRESDFGAAALLVRRISKEFIERDYWIRITPARLAKLAAEVGASKGLVAALTCGSPSYMECLSSYAPVVQFGKEYLSTVTLLSRFIYSWRAKVLDRKKRFQIRAGFIFEDHVKAALAKQGFAFQEIVRINGQEFDVVTVRDGVIWNVQCKNNFVELESVDSNAVAFARYNSNLVRAYERALIKEVKREQLLKDCVFQRSWTPISG